MRRREFLAAGVALAALAQIKPNAALGATSPVGSPKLVGGYLPLLPTSDRHSLTEDAVGGSLCSFDLATREIKKLDIGCGAHGFSQSPLDPALFAAVSRWSISGAVANLRTNSVLKLRAPSGFRFFGHPRFAADGTLYISAASNADKSGRLLVVDPVNGRVMRDLPTGGESPHEFLFVDRDTVLIANTGLAVNKSNLAWIDLRAGKVLRSESVARAGHIRLWNENLLIGAPYTDHAPGFGFYDFKTHSLTSASSAQNFDPAIEAGEGLSQVILGPTLVATTTQRAKGLLFWETAQNTAVHLKFSESTCGLVEHRGLLYMTTLDGRLRSIEVNAKDPAASKVSDVASVFSNSQHMLVAAF